METRPIESQLVLDRYVLDGLMADLVDHDRRPSAYILYLALLRLGAGERAVGASLQDLATATGLSKTAVQRSVVHLKRRGLVSTEATGPVQAPRYRAQKPWLRGRTASA